MSTELAERLAKEPGALAEGEGVEGPPEEGHFDWIREYVYEKQSTSDGTLNDTLVLLREEGGRALFCPLDQRLLLERKGNRRMAKNGTIAVRRGPSFIGTLNKSTWLGKRTVYLVSSRVGVGQRKYPFIHVSNAI